MTRIIGIVSGKGGVGKTTVAANLGVALSSEFNKKVVVIDCNLTTSHLGLTLGLYFPKNINNVLRREASIEEALYVHPSGLRIVTGSLDLNEIKNVDIMNLKRVLKNKFKEMDIVLLDSAPGLGREALATLQASEEIIFVATPYTPSIVDVAKCCQLLEKMKARPIGIILNRVKNQKYELKDKEIMQFTRLPILGKIPEDEKVLESTNYKVPVVSLSPRSQASVALFETAANLVGEKYSPRFSLFDRIISFLRS